jgi:hypothetical protein
MEVRVRPPDRPLIEARHQGDKFWIYYSEEQWVCLRLALPKIATSESNLNRVRGYLLRMSQILR